MVHTVSSRLHLPLAHTLSSAADSVLTFSLSPGPSSGQLGNASSKLSSLSDCWALFRFTRFVIEMCPVVHTDNAGTVGNVPPCRMACGYSPEITDAVPTTLAGVVDSPFATTVVTQQPNGSTTAPVVVWPANRVRYTIPPRLLRATGVPWFRTRLGTFDNNLEIQGFLYFAIEFIAAAVSGVFEQTVSIEYTIEFKDFIGPGQTPKRLPALEEDEKDCEVVETPPPSKSIPARRAKK